MRALRLMGDIASSFHRDTGLQLHSDVLWHKFGLVDCPHGRLAPYIGPGVRLKFRPEDDRFGFRLPIGIAYMLDRPSN